MQPQIGSAGEGLAVPLLRYGLAAFGELVIYNTGQFGVLSGQANVNLGFGGAIYIVYRTYGGNNVTGNINLVIACAGYLAVCILHSVYINLAVSCINCAVAVFLICIDDINLAAVNINGCAADVSKQAVADAGDIYIAVDINGAANCSAVTCMCVQTGCAVFTEAAAVAVQHYFNITVDSSAACMAIYAHSRIIALNVNIYIAVNSKITLSLANTLCTLAALRAVELNNQLISLHRAVHIYILCNACITLAGICYINGQSFAAGINCSALSKIHTLSTFTAYVDRSCFGKFIAAVLNYAAQYIFQILVLITGQGGVEAGGNLILRSARNGNMLSTAALAVSLVEEDVAYGHGYAVAGQTTGNLHLTVKGSLALCIVGIGQLACQCVQSIIDSFRINAQAFVAGNQVNSRALFRMFDNGIACIEGYAVACMLVEDIGVAAIIINGQRTAFLLVDVARSFCGCTAGQLSNMAAGESFTLIYVGQSTLLLVGPGCTVLQIQVELADIMHGIAAAAIVIIILVIGCNALPEGIFIRQGHIDNACIIPVNQLATSVFHNLLAILAGCIHITGNLSGCIACSAVLHVDVQRAFIYADCIEIMRLIAVFSCGNGAAADRYLGILTSQPNAAAAYTGNIYRTTDSYSGSVTCYLNTGSIHACATFSNALDIADCQRAININLALLPLDINTGCGITLRNNIGNFYRTGNIQMCITVSVNAMRASGIRIISCNRKLLLCGRINNLDISISACVNSRCLSAGLCNIQSQTFTGHIYSHRFRRRCFLTCINCAGKFIITGIRFSYINMCNTLIVYLAIQADIFRFSDSACLVIRLIFFRSIVIEALACFFRSIASVRESDIAGGFYNSTYTRRCQTIGNLHYAGKICILVAGVEQLIGQLVQYFLNIILFCCSIISFKAGINSLTIGYQRNFRTFSCCLDSEVTPGDVLRIISIMAVNNSCVTAVIVYGNTLVGILVDYTGTIQLRNIAAGKSCLQRIY